MKTTIEIQNLKCGGCEASILKHLSAIQGIQNVSLDIDKSTVSLEYKNKDVLEQSFKTLAKLGYPVASEYNSLAKKAKSYVSCVIGRTIK